MTASPTLPFEPVSATDLSLLAERLLAIVRKTPSKPVEWNLLEKKLKVERAIIRDAALVLADWDYRISIRISTGITFHSAPDLLTEIELSHELKTTFVGRQLHCYRLTRSTNDLAAEFAEGGAADGTVITAEEQSAGKGRLGRSWYSPAGTGIYLSILLRPAIKPERAPGISVMTALALARTLESYTPGDVTIKWPNDVLIGGRKVAGILTELSADRNAINYLIVGVGLNVNHGVGNFPTELRSSATSLRRVLKRKLHRVTIARQFLLQFEREYLRYLQHDLSTVRKELRSYSSLLGKEITLISGEHRQQGRVVDFDSSGCLVLQQGTRRVSIAAGEVTVVKS